MKGDDLWNPEIDEMRPFTAPRGSFVRHQHSHDQISGAESGGSSEDASPTHDDAEILSEKG